MVMKIRDEVCVTSEFVKKTGDTMEGNLNFDGNKATGLGDATDPTDAVNGRSQGKVKNWDTLGLTDADFAGLDLNSALEMLTSKLDRGQEVHNLVWAGNFPNFYNIFGVYLKADESLIIEKEWGNVGDAFGNFNFTWSGFSDVSEDWQKIKVLKFRKESGGNWYDTGVREVVTTDETGSLKLIADDTAPDSATRNDAQGLMTKFSQAGFTDADFDGLSEQEALALMHGKIGNGQAVKELIYQTSFPNFEAIFPFTNGCQIIIHNYGSESIIIETLPYLGSNYKKMEVMFQAFITAPTGYQRVFKEIITDLGGQTINGTLGVAEPVNDGDCATKGYVDGFFDKEINKMTVPVEIVRDTPTILNEITRDFPAGDYEISFQEFISYDTSRNKYYLNFESSTHTITIPEVVHEPKDADEVNPEFSRVLLLNHTGGDINFKITIEHSSNNVLTVHYADLMIKKL